MNRRLVIGVVVALAAIVVLYLYYAPLNAPQTPDGTPRASTETAAAAAPPETMSKDVPVPDKP